MYTTDTTVFRAARCKIQVHHNFEQWCLKQIARNKSEFVYRNEIDSWKSVDATNYY